MLDHGNTAYPQKDKLAINRRVFSLEFLQEKYQIQDSDRTLDNCMTENHVTHQQSPQRQIPEVNGQKRKSNQNTHAETEETFLQSHE